MLAAGAGGTVDLHFDIGRIDLHIHLFHLRQHRHGGSGGVDSSAGFGFRHSLHPMDAGLVLHPGVGTPAVDDEVRLLHAPQLGIIVVHQLHAPALGGGVHGVHPKQAVGKQGAFLAAHAAPDLHNDAFLVVGVLGQQKDLQLFIQRLPGLLGLGIGLLAELLHLRLRHQLLGFLHVLLRLAIGLVGFHNGLQIVFLPQQGGSGLGVVIKIRLLRLGAELLIPACNGIQFVQHGYRSSAITLSILL